MLEYKIEMGENREIYKGLFFEIKKIFDKIENIKIKIHGSFAMGLEMPWSDLDIIIENDFYKNCNNILIDKIIKILNYEKNLIKEFKYIKETNFPFIKITTTHQYNYKKINLSFLKYKEKTKKSLKRVELIKNYQRIYKPLKPIILILKQILYLSHLNNPYKNGISSYSLILLIVSFLQTKIMMNISIDDFKPNLGILLIDFFNFYNNLVFSNIEIRPKLDVLEVKEAVVIYQKFFPGKNYNFIIRDPLILKMDKNLVKGYYFHLENLFYFVYFGIFRKGGGVLEGIFDTAKNYYLIKI